MASSMIQSPHNTNWSNIVTEYNASVGQGTTVYNKTSTKNGVVIVKFELTNDTYSFVQVQINDQVVWFVGDNNATSLQNTIFYQYFPVCAGDNIQVFANRGTLTVKSNI